MLTVLTHLLIIYQPLLTTVNHCPSLNLVIHAGYPRSLDLIEMVDDCAAQSAVRRCASRRSSQIAMMYVPAGVTINHGFMVVNHSLQGVNMAILG